MAILTKLFLTILKLSAKLQLAKMSPKHIVGITGSAGKTSCKEAVIAVLKDRFNIKTGKPGFNSEFGLPMDILDLDFEYSSRVDLFLKSLIFIPFRLLFDWKKFDALVFEMGIDSPTPPGDMSTLLKIVQPDIGVLLNVLPVHTAYFQITGKELEEELVARIAMEKGKLIESLPESGWAVLNADDKNSIGFEVKTKAKIIKFGLKNNPDVKGFLFDSRKYVFNEDHKYTFSAALAVGKVLGISVEEGKKSLEKNLTLPPGRMSLFVGVKGTTIIDASYNASKIPTISALRSLDEQFDHLSSDPKVGRKIAVLGDMRELGDLAKEEHEIVAREAVNKADFIFTFGPLMEEYFVPEAKRWLGKKGVKIKDVQAFREMDKLISTVKEFVQKGDVILVKGSQNTIFLERFVEALLASSEDVARLCRRGKMWDRKRSTSI